MVDAGYGGISGEQLQNYIQRIEKLEEEKSSLQSDITEVYNEAKANGFDTKIMRQLIRLRKKDHDDHQQEESMLDLYKSALGME